MQEPEISVITLSQLAIRCCPGELDEPISVDQKEGLRAGEKI